MTHTLHVTFYELIYFSFENAITKIDRIFVTAYIECWLCKQKLVQQDLRELGSHLYQLGIGLRRLLLDTNVSVLL